MIHYLYQITNLINDKVYIGVHKTSNLEDGYMGSGKALSAAFVKYGKSNFKKDILEFFDTERAMYERELEIVDSLFVSRKDTYNLTEGGRTPGREANSRGGISTYQRGVGIFSQESLKKRDIWLNSSEWAELKKTFGFSDICRLAQREKWAATENNKKHLLDMNRKSHSRESKAKRRKTVIDSGVFRGTNNPMHGRIRITNEVKNRTISASEEIPEGWRRGMRRR